jgi:hypothetical protein
MPLTIPAEKLLAWNDTTTRKFHDFTLVRQAGFKPTWPMDYLMMEAQLVAG